MQAEILNYSPIPNFTGYKSKFSKSLEKNLKGKNYNSYDEHKLLSEFIRTYNKKVKPKFQLGTGFYGTVYKIDDSYVLKRGNETVGPEIAGIEINKKRKFSNLKHYFGEAVAKIFNNYGEDMTIMKNVYSKGKSIPAGVPDEFAKTHTYRECINYYNKQYLPLFAKLPQKSFNGIASDFAQLNKMCTSKKSYFFDYVNPNNFVLCGKTLRILDEINEDSIRTKNCVTDMLEVFVNRMDIDHNSVFDNELVFLRRQLVKKIILAGVRYQVPMYHSKSDLISWGTTFNDLLGLNIDEKQLNNIIDTINTCSIKNKNVKKRLETAEKYLDNILGITNN